MILIFLSLNLGATKSMITAARPGRNWGRRRGRRQHLGAIRAGDARSRAGPQFKFFKKILNRIWLSCCIYIPLYLLYFGVEERNS